MLGKGLLHASPLGKGVLHRIQHQFCEEESLDHQPHQVTVTTGSVPLKRSPGRGSASHQSRSVLLKKRGSGKRSLKKRVWISSFEEERVWISSFEEERVWISSFEEEWISSFEEESLGK